MLKQLRQHIINNLWNHYRSTLPQVAHLENALKQKGINTPILDHFAMIDLPGPHTGIAHLMPIFSAIGYKEKGRGYLPDKQNDFLWMAEVDAAEGKAEQVLPQVVVADFRLEEMPVEIRNIIEKYAHQASPAPLAKIEALANHVAQNEATAAIALNQLMMQYFAGRDWPLPTVNEFLTVQAFNELLAWVLVFGRRPNHFTLSIHLLQAFNQLADFNRFVEKEVQLALNGDGGVIKGGKASGIAQSSTLDNLQPVHLQDGTVDMPIGFIEFVWRYPVCEQPVLWKDYFTGFVAAHADHVIESLSTTCQIEATPEYRYTHRGPNDCL